MKAKLQVGTESKTVGSSQQSNVSRNSGELSAIVKIDIRKVVIDAMPPPYAYANFLAFCQLEHCEENLVYLNAVRNYRQEAAVFYPTTLVNVEKADSVRALTAGLAHLSTSLDALPTTAAKSTPSNVPAATTSMLKNLLNASSRTANTSTPGSASSRKGSVASVEIATNIRHDSLKTQELYTFFESISDSKMHIPIKPHDMSDVEFELTLSMLNDMLREIRLAFFDSRGSLELNLPARVKKEILDAYAGKQTVHPDLFHVSEEHVLRILKTGAYPKFLIKASSH